MYSRKWLFFIERYVALAAMKLHGQYDGELFFRKHTETNTKFA